MSFVYYNWEEVNINWEALNLNWEEVGYLVSDFLPISGTIPFSGDKNDYLKLKKLNELPKEKKKVIIHIACKIEGTDFEEYKYKNDDDINITIEHVNIIINKILNNIKIKINNIS